MKIHSRWLASVLVVLSMCGGLNSVARAQAAPASHDETTAASQQMAILDTDIGDDIDDAFALALVVRSPEIKLLGITTTYADTELRARLVDRYLAAIGRSDIPVAAGRVTTHDNVFTQAAYAEHEPDHLHLNAVDFLLDQIKQHPGEITLIEIGPMVNVEDAFARDPETFRKLKRVVVMGGSIYRGYGPSASQPTPPEPEWNIKCDPAGAKALLASGVPVYMMPLDSTQIRLETADRERIFSFGSFLTDQLTLLYHQWMALNDYHGTTPTLYDPVAAAYAVRPELCPMTSLRIEVDDNGLTRPVDGEPNVHVCLKSDEKGFLNLLLSRIAQ